MTSSSKQNTNMQLGGRQLWCVLKPFADKGYSQPKFSTGLAFTKYGYTVIPINNAINHLIKTGLIKSTKKGRDKELKINMTQEEVIKMVAFLEKYII